MTVPWGKALPFWWSVVWRGTLYGVLGGIVLGAIGGALAAMLHTPEKATTFGSVGGYIAGIPASMLGVKQALSKHLTSLAAFASGSNI
jgi:Mg/Co/Ni transporter MgtE